MFSEAGAAWLPACARAALEAASDAPGPDNDDAGPQEKLRRAALSQIFSRLEGGCALDVGARDGHFSRLLAETFGSVVALDLQQPQWRHPGVQCVSGDVTHLEFADESFDLVVCTEVLEHILPHQLADAGAELERVTRRYLLIGVPFLQDIRVGRTTCNRCGATNPPWGHVNTFDAQRLLSLFSASLAVKQLSYVGMTKESTNRLSAFLMDQGRNPYGTYEQDEPCVACGQRFSRPTHRTPYERICSKSAFLARHLTEPFRPAHPTWIHCLFERSERHLSGEPGTHGR